MKRSRFFLILILILLVVNAVFFTAWYGFGLKNKLKDYAETVAGKALGGKLSIKSYNLGDRQVYAEGISFTASDSTLSFSAKNLRVRFDLFKFIFTGFRIRHLLQDVEANSPSVSLRIRPSQEKKAPSRFEIPDFREYFKRVRVNGGRLDLDLGIALSFGGGDLLEIRESLRDIKIEASNDRFTTVSLSAVTAQGGRISLKGGLDRGRLDGVTAQVLGYVPSYIHHPALGYPGTEINLELSAHQKDKNGSPDIEAKALLWNTRADLLEKYPVALPFLSADFSNARLKVALSTASIGSSRIGGQIAIRNPLKRPSLDPSSLNMRLDLAMIDASLSGTVSAAVQAEGTFKDPKAKVDASSDGITVSGQRISSIRLNGSYENELVSFESLDAVWMDHQIKAKGSFDPWALSVKAAIDGRPLPSARDLALDVDADLELALYESLPEVKANFRELSVRRGGLRIDDLRGYISLFPATLDRTQSYYIDCELKSPDGQYLSAVGDVLDRSLAVSAVFNTVAVADIYPHELVRQYAPQIRGSVTGFMQKDSIVAQTDLVLALKGELDYSTRLSASGSYNLSNGNAGVFLSSRRGSLNGAPLEFDLVASLQDEIVKVNSLRLNDSVFLTGSLPVKSPEDASLRLTLKDLSTSMVTRFIPDLDVYIPEIKNLNLTGSYNFEAPGEVSGTLSAESVNVDGIKPLSASLVLRGPPDAVNVSGKARSGTKEIAVLDALMDISRGFNIDVSGSVNGIPISDVVPDLPIEAALTGDLRFAYGTSDSAKPGMLIGAKVRIPKLLIPDAPELEDIWLEATQSDELLKVDSLSVSSRGIAHLSGSGALDYNLITNTFFEGNHRLNVKANGELFNWLRKNVDMIIDAGGRSYLSLEIGTHEEQFLITRGNIDIRGGYIQLKDQIEPITAFNMAASVTDNRVSVNRASLLMGNGRLRFFNEFEEDNSNHFFVGFLDLGVFKLAIDEPGVKANIPFFTAPRSLTNIVVKGRDAPYLTVLGPFDDMKIKGDVFLSEGQALYPPNTDNLLNLIYSFRGVLSRPEAETVSAEPVPLPFSLDLMIRLRDNIRYVTYPASLDIQPGGLLHLVYDGQTWSAREANFSSERGRIDFLGTVFQAEYLNINILEAQNLFLIDGSFFKRSADGTVITLRITTNRDASKPLMERLEFNLSSDNPRDRSITDILARLRYSQPSNALSGSQQQNLLQDEALSLLSDNLNASLLSPMFYPLENQVRRFLRLDSFSINAGFIQNLFTQYSNDPNNLAEYVDMQHLMDDITQFSSTILLNNLSISASKYLGRKLFLDYNLTLQEATDLQQRTRILVSHDTSLRMFLPRQFKLGYTFKYEPQVERVSHELMLERSFRFWGI